MYLEELWRRAEFDVKPHIGHHIEIREYPADGLKHAREICVECEDCKLRLITFHES